MSVREGVPNWLYQAVVFLIVLYFGLLAYWWMSEEPIARLASDVVFGVVALALGGMLAIQADRPETPLGIAAVAFVIGGLSQFAFVILEDPTFEVFTTVSVLIGIGLYVFDVLRSD